MKKYKKIAAFSLLAILVSSNAMAAELVVTVDNIKQVQGSLYVSLYKSQADFDSNNNAIKRQKVTVDKSAMTINFGDLPVGEYAAKSYHDVNDNEKLDFSSSGMPSEPFGSSSQSKELAPPDFKNAKFTLDKDQQIQIRLLN